MLDFHKNNTPIKYLLILGILIFVNAFSINYEGSLNIYPGARPVALGGAYTALSDDLSALYFNPAGLVQMNTTGFSFTHNSWLSDINIEYIAGKYKLGSFGHIASGLNITTMGELEGYDIFGNPTEKFTASSKILYITYAKSIISKISAGVNFKYLNDNIEDRSSNAITADVGLLINDIPLKNLNLGFSLSNIFGSMKFTNTEEKLPLIARAGICYTPLDINHFKTTGLFDIEIIRNDGIIYHFGSESIIKEIIAFRVGYRYCSKKLLGNFSVGTGFKYNFTNFGVSLDYAFTPINENELGDISQLTLGAYF